MVNHFTISQVDTDAYPLRHENVNKFALVCEGGGQRGVFTSGVLDAFLKANYNPFHCLIGTSAGALNLASYACGQYRHAYDVINKVTRDPNFFNIKNIFRGENSLNLDLLIHATETHLALDWETGLKNLENRELYCVATNINSMKAKCLDLKRGSWKKSLKATCAIPLLTINPIKIDNEDWYDGGVTAPIPVRKAYKLGYKHIVVIRTIPIDASYNHEWLNFLKKVGPNKIKHLSHLLMTHEDAYRADQEFLENPPDDVVIYEIHPATHLKTSLVNSTKKAVDSDYALGFEMGKKYLNLIADKIHKGQFEIANVAEIPLKTKDDVHTAKKACAEVVNNLKRGSFNGFDKVRINWINYNPHNKKDTLVIVNGRNESYWGYLELIYELSYFYNIYTYDHRGQGESERGASDLDLGHVNEFQDYIVDLQLFMDKVVYPNSDGECYLAGHSMGANICTQYIQLYEHKVKKLLLSAPMFGLGLSIKSKLDTSSHSIVERFTKKPNYALGRSFYDFPEFDKNVVTNSKLRYSRYTDSYNEKPNLKLNGPSTKWIQESIKACDKALINAHKVDIPVLILQAGHDYVVSNLAQDKFNETCPSSYIEVIEGALHGLFIEEDKHRDIAVNKLIFFMKN
ncbi:alpha/beta fold hydrolase [Shewanella gelidimarina]|uniref:alpha/beta fold hydrolase n=1 Tax=Shewanella gelidimarina TaxID=56813 RepID=UPI00200F0834|nr:alpha/beta fold hydrolase [Shewanella gelidimarina]MCL1058979.1 alpha/beta fold hydrolase [Shewanella gelidimarina]